MAEPMVDKYEGKNKLTSVEFLKIFNKYDKDGNGTIEKSELDHLLQDIIKQRGEDKSKLADYKKEILSKYDENCDEKLSLHELSNVLPTAENFLLQFKNSSSLHTVDFMKIWYHYDVDRSGYLETNELKGFLHDLLGKTTADGGEVTVAKLNEYTSYILELFDNNGDGKIELAELAKIMPLQDNFLQKFKGASLSNSDFDELFNHYDQDNNGYIEDTELMGFLRDLLEKKDLNPTTLALEQYRTCIMDISDTDRDGRLNKSELKVLLTRN